jgi:hypothetical protein
MVRSSRRKFLRGAGVALALPWLESLKANVAGPAAEAPTRFGCVYFSNGVEPAHWWVKGEGAAMEVGPALQPMQAHREDMIFVRGLFHKQAMLTPSPHLGRAPNVLSGAPISLDPAVIRCGTSFDQVLAQHLGGQTAVPSFVLGIEPNELRLEDGLSMVYGSSISWVSPSRPAAKEIYPARVFDLLVGDGTARQVDRSILDAARGDASALKSGLSRGDRHKLDEYLESVRSIEKRIERASKEERLEGWRPTVSKPAMARPADEIPRDVPEHMKLMLDLIVLAFQMDKTRVATLMLNNDLSQMNMKFIPGVQGALHLDLTHNGKAPAVEAMYLKTNQFHIAQFAYLVERMKQTDDGNGESLLDHSILMCCSSLFDGDAHSAEQLPILLAGRGGGKLKLGGRNLDYLAAGDEHRRACSLYLSLMDRMGVSLDRFGDSGERLANL